MVLKLYGFNGSPNTHRTVVIFIEMKVPFELVAVDFAQREHKSPEYLDKQPFGQVPYIDDDGFILYESWAIARYVCEKYRDQGPDLLPTDLKMHARIDQAASVEQTEFFPFGRIIVWEGIVKKLLGQQADQAKFDEAKATLEEKLDGYERILSKQKYLAGDELTLVDLMHLGYGPMLSEAGCNALADAEKRPNVVRWFKEIQSRPSWQTLLKDGIKSTA